MLMAFFYWDKDSTLAFSLLKSIVLLQKEKQSFDYL